MWRFCLDSRTFYQKASIKLKNSKMRRLLGTWKGCLEVHMWIQVHTCVCSEARCQHLPASPMSVLHLTGFFETESLTEPAHHWVPRLTGQQEHFCLLLPSTEIMGVPPHAIPNFLFICLFSESAKDLHNKQLFIQSQTRSPYTYFTTRDKRQEIPQSLCVSPLPSLIVSIFLFTVFFPLLVETFVLSNSLRSQRVR